jgi:riboflavin kinase/FMN adenylyltransferase
MLPDGSISEEDFEATAPIISSSEIRSLLLAGNIRAANDMRQRPYSLCGTVEYGKQLGRTIGFPTANLPFSANKIVPLYGVYATLCHVGSKCYRAVSNIGTRPTVDDDRVANCETHLLDFCDDLYGKEIEISFLEHLRPEQKFSSLDQLRAAIARDIAAAKTYFTSALPNNV